MNPSLPSWVDWANKYRGGHIDWKEKEAELCRAFLNNAEYEDPVSPPLAASPGESYVGAGFKKEFNWLLCLVFPNGTRDKTISRDDAKEFYKLNFFPEEIVRHGQILSAKTMENETRAFIRAFDQLPHLRGGECSLHVRFTLLGTRKETRDSLLLHHKPYPNVASRYML